MGYRSSWGRSAVAGIVLLTGAWALPILIRGEKWFYLVGLGLAGVFAYTVLRGWLELGIVCCIAGVFVLETIFTGYWTVYELYTIGASDMILIALWLAYLARLTATVRGAGDYTAPAALRIDGTEFAFAVFATCLLGTAISARYWFDMPNIAYSHFLEFGVRGGLMFALTWRVMTTLSPTRIRAFLLALLFLGLFISVNENANILAGQSLLHIRGVRNVWWVRVTEGQEEITRSIVGTRYFVPFGGVTEDAGAFMAPLFAFAVALCLSTSESRRLRVLYALAAASLGMNTLLYMQRAAWAGAASGALSAALFQRRKAASVLAIGGGVGALVVCLSYAGILWARGTPHDPLWVVSSIVKSDRWVLWLNTLEALPHFPLLFGTGLLNTYHFAYTLALHSTRSYGHTMASWYSEFASPHNTYLQLLVGAGVPAFAAVMTLLAYGFKSALSALKGMRQGITRHALLGVFAALVALATLSFFQRSVLHRDYNLFFNFLLGATVGLARNRADNPRLAEE